jgi:hypothetical protein
MWNASAHLLSGTCDLSITVPTVTVEICKQVLQMIWPRRRDLPFLSRCTLAEPQRGQIGFPSGQRCASKYSRALVSSWNIASGASVSVIGRKEPEKEACSSSPASFALAANRRSSPPANAKAVFRFSESLTSLCEWKPKSLPLFSVRAPAARAPARRDEARLIGLDAHDDVLVAVAATVADGDRDAAGAFCPSEHSAPRHAWPDLSVQDLNGIGRRSLEPRQRRDASLRRHPLASAISPGCSPALAGDLLGASLWLTVDFHPR